MDFRAVLMSAAQASGGVAAPPAYVRTAFVDSGAGGGSLNNPSDPYPNESDALAALAGAYAGQSVTLAFKSASAGNAISRAQVETFTALTVFGFGGVMDISTTTWVLDGDAGANGSFPTNGGNAAPATLTFDAVTVGTVTASGGVGGTATDVGSTGPGSTGGHSITINLLNGTVAASITANGGDGGAGADGDGGNAGGDGGTGGSGATIDHDGTSSATVHSEAGGTGGAGGADGGAGAGSAGANGGNGSYS